MLTESTRAAVLANARNAGRQWARNRASLDDLRKGAFPEAVIADLVTWPCALDEIAGAFREGARVGLALRSTPDMQLPGQPPQPFKTDW